MAIDQLELERRRQAEQAARNEAARQANVEPFTRMFLGLGVDSIKVAGSSYDAQLAEARGLASHRWNVLLNQEAQIIRDEQTLAGRPKKRPSVPSDDTVPDRTLETWNAAWEAETQSARDGLKQLKQEAARERRELESYRVDLRRK